MTGMKDGAGEDPFAEDTEAPVGEGAAAGGELASESPKPEENHSAGERAANIPYKFRRGSVQEGRDRVPLFIQEDTKEEEREVLRDLEDKFGENVSLTDLREALVKTGAQHIDEVGHQLEEWGYGIKFGNE